MIDIDILSNLVNFKIDGTTVMLQVIQVFISSSLEYKMKI